MSAWTEFLRTLGILWRIALDGALLASARPRARPAGAAAVCVVRVDSIGDFVLWIGDCRRLLARSRANGTRMVLVANGLWADWARELGLADEVWAFDRGRFAADFRYRSHWLGKMRAYGFDTLLQPAHSRRPAECDALARASAARERIGSLGDCTNSAAWLKRWADSWYTRLVDCGGSARMELLRNADFMRGLGFADFRARVPALGATLPPNPSGLAPRSYAVLVPGAGADMRAWPIALFAETGRRLAARGLGLVLVGGSGDRAAAQALQQALADGARDFTGRTTLGQLAAILADAQVVVSNETGAAHMAAAAGTPVVCVMGGGHYGRFMPYQVEEAGASAFPVLPLAAVHRMDCFGCNWHCIHARAQGEPVKCVKDLALDEVWPQVSACLAPVGTA